MEGAVTQGEKHKETKEKQDSRERLRVAQEESAEINWELNPSYHSLIFVFSIYSWGCVSWPKLCSLFFFYKP